MLNWLLTLDSGVLLWIQTYLRGPVQDAVLCFYTTLGNAGALFLIAAALLLCFKKTRKAGVTALLAMAIGFICTNLVLKHLVSRPRPWLDVAGLTALVTENDPNSFPSGHSTAAFAFASALWRTAPSRWMKWAALAAAVLMGFSRLYVGVHYPSDVLVGVAVGLLAGWLASLLVRRLQQKKQIG
ncbi:MAG: phosphatase PAP2 family protein [Oscillospiraceae bacterium]